MKLKPEIPHVVKPAGNQERVYKCEDCGKVFVKGPFLPLLPVKCPHCGSFKTVEDARVRY